MLDNRKTYNTVTCKIHGAAGAPEEVVINRGIYCPECQKEDGTLSVVDVKTKIGYTEDKKDLFEEILKDKDGNFYAYMFTEDSSFRIIDEVTSDWVENEINENKERRK